MSKINKMKKNMRGITLIALVITIIVLLILAGVTIAMLTGENGIIKQAQNAKDITDKKTAEEELLIEWLDVKAEEKLKQLLALNVPLTLWQ